ncbi:Subtilisin-like protease [Platanthera guangdongensis]|uniref:Subtilisin-like protease n=1 Tax=Platanthera guangdongensis TaxID=2320717 RepID=A0ABR2MT76_9ASPA
MAPAASSFPFALVFFFLLLFSSITDLSFCNNQSTFIVFMNPSLKPTPIKSHSLWYASDLQSLSIDPSLHLLYSYSSLVSAFAASLLPHHLPLLHSHPAVLLLLPDPLLHPLTTRTPFFLRLPSFPLPPSPSPSSDIIIGILDTGVWPESPSFADNGLPHIPSRWRGQCEPSVDFPPSLCNRKLIGARSFSRGFHASAGDTKEHFSARDQDGHGTHTASTAAGTPALNASLFGYANGIARGMAPLARIAAYKVCWSTGCFGSDILAAMEQAIADGVDVLSLSLGGGSAPLSRDPVSVGALSAVARGVFVACSAGNSGPARSTLTNTAPWIATIGAGTLDRDFPAYATIGTGERFAGVSLYSGAGMASNPVPVVYGRGSHSKDNSSKLCLAGSLDPAEVKGKVVFCDRGINARVEKGQVVKDAGGVGMILANIAVNGEELVADSHLLPAVALGSEEGDKIRNYVTSEPNATALLTFSGTVVDIRPSPVVAAFSSRGPNTVVPEILKPDLIGPGVNILAGWSGSIGPTGLEKDERRSEFNILSGTSMSCPHISGVAALLKAAHPSWSPAAIKSALMTTAYVTDNTGAHLRDAGGSAATPMAYGSGYVDPQKALNPGLVYDAKLDDYVAFLCSIEPSVRLIQSITKNPKISCSRKLPNPGDLNYPSFSVLFNKKSRKAVKYGRVVTNVAPKGSVYSAAIEGPAAVDVVVKPAKLVFKKEGQKLRYSVTFSWKKGRGSEAGMAFGSITWSDGEHQVRSPISYTWSLF